MKEQLARFMQQKGLTQTQVAKALGKSNAVISQYLKGIYKGVTKDIDEAVERLIKREKRQGWLSAILTANLCRLMLQNVALMWCILPTLKVKLVWFMARQAWEKPRH